MTRDRDLRTFLFLALGHYAQSEVLAEMLGIESDIVERHNAAARFGQTPYDPLFDECRDPPQIATLAMSRYYRLASEDLRRPSVPVTITTRHRSRACSFTSRSWRLNFDASSNLTPRRSSRSCLL